MDRRDVSNDLYLGRCYSLLTRDVLVDRLDTTGNEMNFYYSARSGGKIKVTLAKEVGPYSICLSASDDSGMFVFTTTDPTDGPHGEGCINQEFIRVETDFVQDIFHWWKTFPERIASEIGKQAQHAQKKWDTDTLKERLIEEVTKSYEQGNIGLIKRIAKGLEK
jgi:hypothetical protein